MSRTGTVVEKTPCRGSWFEELAGWLGILGSENARRPRPPFCPGKEDKQKPRPAPRVPRVEVGAQATAEEHARRGRARDSAGKLIPREQAGGRHPALSLGCRAARVSVLPTGSGLRTAYDPPKC